MIDSGCSSCEEARQEDEAGGTLRRDTRSMYIGRALGIKICGCAARRRIGPVAFALAFVCRAIVPSIAAAAPNIVVIMSDDIGYNEVGFNSTAFGGGGNAPPVAHPISTPSPRKASSPVRATPLDPSAPPPARACSQVSTNRSLVSKRISAVLRTQFRPQAIGASITQQVTIAQRLKNVGYSTGLIGKWHLGYQNGFNLPKDKGFDEFYGLWNGGRSSYFPTPAEFEVRRIRKTVGGVDVDWENNWGSEGDQSQYDPTHGRYLTDALGEEAADYINRHANDANPFFLMVPLTAPHDPFHYKQSD